MPTPGPTGPASVTGPATAIAGAPIEVSWNGPNENDDYVTIVAAGATKWTNESWFYTRSSSNGTGKLQTSVVDGDYELWYVQGDTDAVLSRTAIRLLPWAGTLDGPASVKVNTQFQVTWTGPDGQGDYVAILPSGATAYTNESYFYTHSTTNGVGSLLSPMAAGNYQLSYLAGTGEIMLSEPITVTP